MLAYAPLERVDLDNLTILKLKGSLTSEGLEPLEEPFASRRNSAPVQ